MPWLRVLASRIRGLFLKRRLDREFDQELRTHIETLTEENVRRGMTPEEWVHAAPRTFGGLEQVKQIHREQRGVLVVDTLIRDARYALRTLGRNPSFTIIAVLTLAVGMGVNTAIFSAYNAVALRPIQVPEPGRVVQLIHNGRSSQHFSYPDYLYYRDNNEAFSGLVAMDFAGFDMTGVSTPDPIAPGGIAGAVGFQFPQLLTGGSETILGALVSGNYFKVLRVDPVLGRIFLPVEDAVSAQPVALVSYNFWERRFARDPGLLGRNLTLNGIGFAVIGITARDFLGTAPNVPDLWVPMTTKARLTPEVDPLHDRNAVCCRVYGRLRPGVALGQAEAQMNTLAARLPEISSGMGGQTTNPRVRIALNQASPFGAPDAGSIAIAVLILAAVSLVLLIACANVASLMLARSAARQKEIAIRLAIGASRRQLIRQLLTESALVSLLAGGTGLVFSWWSLHFLMLQVAASLPTYWGTIALHVAPDHRVFAYMLLLSVTATAAFGLAPALEASKPNLTSALKEEGAAFGGRLRKSRLRDLMVGTQVAVCLVLLIAAGLLALGSRRAFAVDLGFDYRNLISVRFHFPKAMRSTPARIEAMQRQLIERFKSLPGVSSVAVAGRMPLAGGNRNISVSLDGRGLDDRNAPDALFNQVTPSYFDTMGIPIVRGRSFTSQETRDSFNFDGAPIVVSEGTARQFWPRQDPIGKRLTFGAGASSTRWEGEEYPHSVSSTVVGIAKDVRSADLREVDDTCLYLPITDAWGGAIVMRTRGDPKTVVTAVRRELSAIDSNLEAVIEDSQTAFTNQTAFVVSRLGAIGSAIIGILGLLMASVGIYGTVGFAVTQRTHEIGVRMVLGARPRNVLGLVLAETMRPVAIGLAAGLAGAAMVSRALSSLLFDLSPLDPEVYLGVSVFLMGVALLAGYVPAHRATKVDPMVALRYE